MPDEYPVVASWFGVEFQDQITGAFQKCTGFGSEHEVVEHRASGPNGPIIRKMPGNIKWNTITLSRGLTSSIDMWKWREQVEKGEPAARNGTITMYNHAGKAVARWDFINAWPSKLTGPSANATANEVGIEELELTHEGYSRVM